MTAVMVLGSAGLVGSAIAEHFESVGVSTVRHIRPKAKVKHGDVPVDLTSPNAAEELIAAARSSSVTAVVHCAAELPSSHSGGDAERVAEVNAKLDRAAVRLAAECGLRLVYISSVSVYGFGQHGLLDEESATNPAGPYARAKLRSERDIAKEVESHAVLRIPSPYGPQQRSNSVLKVFVTRAAEGGAVAYLGSGRREQDFIHVDDIARAVLVATIRASATGIFNIASGSPVTMADLAALVVRRVGNGASIAVAAHQSDPQEGYQARYDISKAERELSWRPHVRLTDGIEQCARAWVAT